MKLHVTCSFATAAPEESRTVARNSIGAVYTEKEGAVSEIVEPFGAATTGPPTTAATRNESIVARKRFMGPPKDSKQKMYALSQLDHNGKHLLGE